MVRNSHWLILCVIMTACPVFCNAMAKPATEQREKSDGKVEEQYEPSYGGRLIIGTCSDPYVLLPILANDSASAEVMGFIYNGLTKHDKNMNIVGDLAERWEISKDRLTIRFFLRRGVKWHDGQPFTAKDVEFTYKCYINPKTPTQCASQFKKVKAFKVVDDHIVEVTYEKPYAPALRTWITDILPRHLLEGKDITKSPLITNPIGTGPYKFKKWKIGEKIILEANQDYFEGKPYVSEIIFRIVSDMDEMFLDLKSARIDTMHLTPEQYRQAASGPLNKKYRTYKQVSFGYKYLGYNHRDWRFKDKKVRQAITTAIDRERIVKEALLGLGRVVDTPYKPDSYWYNQTVKQFAYDPEKAKKMLADAGWTDTDKDGVIDKDGEPFFFIIATTAGNPVDKKTAAAIRRDLKKVGIKVGVLLLEWTDLVESFVASSAFEACLMGWRTGLDPDQTEIWSSPKPDYANLNFIGYENPEVDRLLELGVSTYDKADRKKHYDKLQEIIADDQPTTFLYAQDSFVIISSRVKGIEPSPMGIWHNFTKWYIPESFRKYQTKP